MSIKIYSGLKATDSNPFLVAKRIRNILEQNFLKEWKNIVENVAGLPEGAVWSDTEGYFFGNEPVERDPYFIYNKIVKLNEEDDSFAGADIYYHVVIVENANGGNPLVLIYGNKSTENTQLLIDAGVVTEYGYWDNTDIEEGITAEEWAERKKAWSNLDSELSPAEIGLTIEPPARLTATFHLIPEM